MIIHKYCINCEEQISNYDPVKNGITDFCSDKCSQEYAASCDTELLNRARNTNPDALPINNIEITSPWGRKRVITTDGSLPPNSEDAIASMLKIGGVSQADIAKVLQTKSSNESEPK